MSQSKHPIPASGWNGLVQHWRNDLIAAFSVALVALPLSLGIGIASGVSPMSGLIAGIIGGLVTTFFRGGHLAINGPAAGLIAVILGAITSMDDGSGNAMNYMLAAVVVSGIIQILMGVFRLGKLANAFPSSVIQGMLAAIGIIILSKQLHVALGTESEATQTITILLDAFRQLPQVNPFIAIISVASILLLAFHNQISYKLFHVLPAPIWVLIIAIPFVYLFNFLEPHTVQFLGTAYELGPSLLIQIPGNPLDAVLFPNFSQIGTPAFWMAVFSITLIASLETLAIAKAIDKLDPYQRITNSNKDLIGNGLATLVCGCIGGLPIIPVIARSSVNVQNNAKTKWSNLYNGLFLLLFVVLLAPIIQKVPLAALAAILVYTGYKLAAPRVFRQAYEQGIEQLLFFSATVIITLYSDLLWGIFGGILVTLSVHILLSRLPVDVFFRLTFRSEPKLEKVQAGQYHLAISGVANFLSLLKINQQLDKIPDAAAVEIDLSEARLVDLTIQERLNDFVRRYNEQGGQASISGMTQHIASVAHPLALKSKVTSLPEKRTPRQERFAQLAAQYGWAYQAEGDRETSYLREFQFFETRPIEFKSNILNGRNAVHNVEWMISDITFDEGALLATEIYNTTVAIVHLPRPIPRFILEREQLFDKIFDRVMAFSGQRDIDFQLFTKFSRKFLLKGEDEVEIRSFFTPELIEFLEQQEEIYHIESNGEALLIFKYLRPAKVEEISKMLTFSERLLSAAF